MYGILSLFCGSKDDTININKGKLNISTVRFKRENPDLSLLDLKFRNMQGFRANMEISFMKYGSFMQKFAPFETFVKIM